VIKLVYRRQTKSEKIFSSKGLRNMIQNIGWNIYITFRKIDAIIVFLLLIRGIVNCNGFKLGYGEIFLSIL
jgi:hypothetical protein